MGANKKNTDDSWDPETAPEIPDDAPEWTDEMFARAQIAVGGKVIREATGTLTRRGRPPVGDEPKQQVTLRLAPKVIRYFKETGEGWQTRLNETLEEYVTATVVKEARRRTDSMAKPMNSRGGDGGGSGGHKTTRSASTGKFSKRSTGVRANGTEKK